MVDEELTDGLLRRGGREITLEVGERVRVGWRRGVRWRGRGGFFSLPRASGTPLGLLGFLVPRSLGLRRARHARWGGRLRGLGGTCGSTGWRDGQRLRELIELRGRRRRDAPRRRVGVGLDEGAEGLGNPRLGPPAP